MNERLIIIRSLATAGLLLMIEPDTLSKLFLSLLLFFIAMFIYPEFLGTSQKTTKEKK